MAWEDAQTVHKRLHVHNERFADVTNQQRVLETKIDNNRAELIKLIDTKTKSFGSSSGDRVVSHVKMDLPTYSGATFEQPVRFLNNFTNYVEAVGATEHTTRFLIEQALRSTASDWWEHVRDRVDNLEDFRDRFLHRFWNSSTQARIRRELEFGTYTAANNLSRSEYVLRLYNMVRALTNPRRKRYRLIVFRVILTRQLN